MIHRHQPRAAASHFAAGRRAEVAELERGPAGGLAPTQGVRQDMEGVLARVRMGCFPLDSLHSRRSHSISAMCKDKTLHIRNP